jgi:phosphinothricin acetyltransferase
MIALRPSVEADIPAIAAIYDRAVLTGLASFEVDPPGAAEMARRRAAVLAAGYPHIVAVEGDERLGYAYASAYRTRPAYRFTVENSVYVAEAARGRGVGRLLIERLVSDCTALGYRQMIAVIGDSGNAASIGLHAACGFVEVGRMTAIGFKFGRWVDSVLMQRPLGEGQGTPLPVEAAPDLHRRPAG